MAQLASGRHWFKAPTRLQETSGTLHTDLGRVVALPVLAEPSKAPPFQLETAHDALQRVDAAAAGGAPAALSLRPPRRRCRRGCRSCAVEAGLPVVPPLPGGGRIVQRAPRCKQVALPARQQGGQGSGPGQGGAVKGFCMPSGKSACWAACHAGSMLAAPCGWVRTVGPVLQHPNCAAAPPAQPPHLRSSSAGGSPASFVISGTAPRKRTGASPSAPALPASIAAAPLGTAAAGTAATLFSSWSSPIWGRAPSPPAPPAAAHSACHSVLPAPGCAWSGGSVASQAMTST